MAYKHGVYGSEVPTSLVPMTEISAGLPVVFGTAPINMASDAAKPNVPVLCYKYSEAVATFGYSDDWGKYTLCEFMKSQFSMFNMTPVVLINVLDPSVHKQTADKAEVELSDGKATIKKPVIIDSLVVEINSDGDKAELGEDYTVTFEAADKVVIEAIEGGQLNSLSSIYVEYNYLEPAAVSPNDIVGGVDAVTGAKKGLELVDEIYPRFGLIPGIIIAPGWSHNSGVTAAMTSKASKINGRFEAICLADISTDDVINYSKAYQWKSQKNFNDPQLVACWPQVALDGQRYHMSTQMTGVMCATDAAHDDVPYWSPSNHSLKCDSAVTGPDGEHEVYLDAETAAYLNSQGIVTAINQGGWVLWGNRTSCYPNNTDVKDAFVSIRRMFCWINNTLITTFWQKIDNPVNKRLIATVVDSANIWLNGLTARGYLLGGRVEFREDENTTTGLMDGIINFHVYITPPSPAREINFIQEYDVSYINTLFE